MYKLEVPEDVRVTHAPKIIAFVRLYRAETGSGFYEAYMRYWETLFDRKVEKDRDGKLFVCANDEEDAVMLKLQHF